MAKVPYNIAHNLERIFKEDWSCKYITGNEAVDMMKMFYKLIPKGKLDFMYSLVPSTPVTVIDDTLQTSLILSLEFISEHYATTLGRVEDVMISKDEMTLTLRTYATVHKIIFKVDERPC